MEVKTKNKKNHEKEKEEKKYQRLT